jgi:hypothetical protein
MTSDDVRWHGLLRSGSVAAGLIALLLIGEAAVFATWSRPATPLAHIELFQREPLVGLLTLDLLGLVAYLLFVPTILALYVVLRRTTEARAAVGAVLFFLGVADFFATNTAFPVLGLSQDYAAASSEAERAAVLAAGQAMFVLFNENAFLVSYAIVSASWALLGAAMLRSPEFGRSTAWLGILAGVAGVVAVILEHLSDVLVPVAIPVYFAAIGFLFGWVVLVARELGRLAAELNRGVR